MKPRKSELLFIVLVFAEILIIFWVYGYLHPEEQLLPATMQGSTIYGEILRKGSCSAYQQPYPKPNQYWKSTLDITTPDGKTFLCLTNLPPAEIQVSFSPDGQYMRLFISFTHKYRYSVFEISTLKEMCWDETDSSGTSFLHHPSCPYFK